MELYARVPMWLVTDGGVLSLPIAAQNALFRVAMNGGVVTCGSSPERALDALCAGASTSLDEMRRMGLVSLDGGRIHLMRPDGLPSTVAARDEAAEPRRAPDVGRDERHVEPTGPRTVTRADRRYFERRERCWRNVPAGVTFEAWLSTPEGSAWMAGATGRQALHLAKRNASATQVQRVALHPPSHTLPSQKEGRDKEEASDAGARDHEAQRPDQKCNASATLEVQRSATESATVPACFTVETLTAREITAGDALMALRGDAQLRLTVTTQQELELDRVLADVAARGQGWTLRGTARLAIHLRAQHVATGRDGRPWTPTASSLRGDGSWTRLLALYDEADGCPRCAEERDARRAREATPKPPAQPEPRAPISPELIAFMKQVRDAAAAQIAARDAKHIPLTTTTETPAHG
mgnify:CR=1 FL=1